jgi:hypothetical protein
MIDVSGGGRLFTSRGFGNLRRALAKLNGRAQAIVLPAQLNPFSVGPELRRLRAKRIWKRIVVEACELVSETQHALF